MGDYIIRIGSSLVFDESKEKDIIEFAEKLNAKRKMSMFLSEIFRTAVDCPDALVVSNVKDMLNSNELTQVRSKYFNGISAEISDIKKKLDNVYLCMTEVYTASKVGKAIGIEDRAVGVATASFLVERQLSDLAKRLSINIEQFKSEQSVEFKERAGEVLEFVIDNYSDVLSELSSNDKIAQSSNDELIRKLENEVAEAKAENDRLNKYIRGVEENKNNSNDEVEKLQSRIKQLEEENSKLTREVKNKDMTISDLRDETELLRKRVKRITSEYENSEEYSNEDLMKSNSEEIVSVTNNEEEEDTDNEEVLDFGESANMDALTNFFGLSQ